MTTSSPKLIRRTVLAGLLTLTVGVGGLSTVAHAAPNPPQADSVPTGADAAAHDGDNKAKGTPRVRKGQAAVDGLGSRLDDLARESKVSPAELKQHLLRDKTLQVGPDGTLEVADTLGGTGATVTTGSTNTLIFPIGDTLRLHSNPNSPRKIYLDFNGHTTVGTQWNTGTGIASIQTPVWGRDANASTFNTSEAAAIQQSFASVVEDFAAFDVDVTTEDPGIEALRKTSATDTQYGTRVVVGPNTWLNVDNSGYAKIGSFNWNSDTPAFCFANAATPTKQIAECISHETGHTVGLYHDGTPTTEYYGGHNNWAPIMGNSYSRPVTQWSSGQYPNANNFQNDLAVIGGYLNWMADDYVGTTATSATLPNGVTRFGRVSYGTGELDAFKFSLTGTRNVNLQAWEYYQAIDPDLNLRVRLTNASGAVIATNSPTGTTRTNMTVSLAAGTYYVFVDGVGEGTASTGYTNYASMGLYNVLLKLV